MFKFSTRSTEILSTVDERLQKIAAMALVISPIDFGFPPTGGLRSQETQYELFKDGKSKADGFSQRSYHQTGQALDFYAYVEGKASWEKEHLAVVAAAFLQAAAKLGYPLEWGGLWKNFKDYPHVQLVAV